MEDKFDLDDYEYRKFLESFISNRESETRSNITVISAVCEVLADEGNNFSKEEQADYINRIMVSCCNIMKMTELYTKLTRTLFNAEISFLSVDLNRFLKEFAEKCKETLGMKCDVLFDTTGEVIFAESNEEFLEYILLGCVRKSVIDGASKVRVCVEKMPNNDVTVTVAAEEFGGKPQPALAEKDMVTKNLVEINKNLTKKINADFSCENDIMRITLFHSESTQMHLKLPELSYPTRTFTSYHNMLSDLGEYKFF